MHTALPSPLCPVWVPYLRKEVEVRGSGSQHHQLCRRHGVPTLPKQRGSPHLLPQNRLASLPPPPKPHGPRSLLPQNLKVLSLSMAAVPGFKSQHQSSSAAPFPAPPTIGHRCQHSGRCGPVTWSRLSPSSSGPHYKSLFGAPLLAAPCYKKGSASNIGYSVLCGT